jgi:hypothetical protein
LSLSLLLLLFGVLTTTGRMVLPCCLQTWLLFATIATAAISPSNSSTVGGGQFPGTLPLQHADGDQAQIASLVALTKQADQATVRHILVLN